MIRAKYAAFKQAFQPFAEVSEQISFIALFVSLANLPFLTSPLAQLVCTIVVVLLVGLNRYANRQTRQAQFVAGRSEGIRAMNAEMRRAMDDTGRPPQ